MRAAVISPRKQADRSWRGSHQRTSHQPQMQERSALGRLLNATIVVCGACYILYVAVYLGLDLKSVFAKPQHETYKVRLHLHSKPAAWDGQEPLQLHSAASPGAAAKDPDIEFIPDGKDNNSDPSRTTEEPVPGVGILASQTDTDTSSKASAESRTSDISNTAALAKQQLTNEADLPDVIFSDSLPSDKGVDTYGLKESEDTLDTPVPGDGMLASMLVSETEAEQAELDASKASAESSDHDTSDDAPLADEPPADPIRGTLYEELFTGDHPAIDTWMENVGEGRVKEPYIPKGSLSKEEEGSDTKPVTSSKVAEAALSAGKSADSEAGIRDAADLSAARDMEHDSLTLDEEKRGLQALGLNEEKKEEAREELKALILDEEEEAHEEELEQEFDGPSSEGVKLAAKSAEAEEDAFLASMKDSESQGKQKAPTSMSSNRLAADTDKTAGKGAKTESLVPNSDDPKIVEEEDELDLPLLSFVGSDRLSADLDKTTGKAAKTEISLAASDDLDLRREEDDLLDSPLSDSLAEREDRDIEEEFPVLSSTDGGALQFGDELPDEPLRR